MKAIIPKRVIAFLFGIDYVAESAEQIFESAESARQK